MASILAEPGNRRAGRDRRTAREAGLAAELAAAITGQQIEVLFQPQYAASDGHLLGAEALARWRRRGDGLIGGEELFALAASCGQVTQISRALARAALSAAARWDAPLRLSLNVTAADLAAEDFAEQIAALLDETGFPHDRLTLEITEQSLVDDLDAATARLQVLAENGVHVALDDFGAGFCHFGYLKQLPLHALKLDRSMVEGVAENPRDLAVLRAIVAMARALDLEVIAEGVETEAQREVIAREGCAAWQGFHGAAPMSAAAFEKLVTTGG